MATGMQSWSTTASSNANADANVNWAEGMAPSQVDDSARAMMASAAKWIADNNGTLTTSGSSTAFTLTTNQVQGSLQDGYTIECVLHTEPDAGATISLDGTGIKPLKTKTNATLGVNQVLGRTIQRLTYLASVDAWLLNSFNSGMPVGAIAPFAGSASPGGWLLCDGTGYNQGSYSVLYNVIGTTYGSTGASMFSVPDLRGRFIAGKEAVGNLLSSIGTSTNLGGIGGAQNQVLTQANMPVTGPTWTSGIATIPVWNGATGNFSQSGSGAQDAFVRQADLSNTSMSGTVAGGSATPVPTVPPTFILNYIIYAGTTNT